MRSTTFALAAVEQDASRARVVGGEELQACQIFLAKSGGARGRVLYLAGSFRGIAPEGNASGNLLAVDAATSLPIPDFAGVGGNP